MTLDEFLKLSLEEIISLPLEIKRAIQSKVNKLPFSSQFDQVYKQFNAAYSLHQQTLLSEAKAKGEFPAEYDAVFHSEDGYTPHIVENVVAVKTSKGELKFHSESGAFPKLPLLAFGERWNEGWDIPTVWALDADGVGWVDDAHGGYLTCVEGELTSYFFDDYDTLCVIAKALKKPPPMPEWMKTALSHGWTPPSDFDGSKYQ